MQVLGLLRPLSPSALSIGFELCGRASGSQNGVRLMVAFLELEKLIFKGRVFFNKIPGCIDHHGKALSIV
jgi:hypothetical protein